MTPFDLAARWQGLREVEGIANNPAIVTMLRIGAAGHDNELAALLGSWPGDDETPWCGGFCSFSAWLARVDRPKPGLRARSWLTAGRHIPLGQARIGLDVVVLKRGGSAQPGPEVLQAPGHVGFYAGHDEARMEWIELLGGNQGDRVCVARYPYERILGVRRLSPVGG